MLQVIEVLKEQVYHSSVVTSLMSHDRNSSHPLLTQLEESCEKHEENVAGKAPGRFTRIASVEESRSNTCTRLTRDALFFVKGLESTNSVFCGLLNV